MRREWLGKRHLILAKADAVAKTRYNVEILIESLDPPSIHEYRFVCDMKENSMVLL